jgi:uncharacterized protein YciI/uncharacterized protein YndB with AHSA1/START domain
MSHEVPPIKKQLLVPTTQERAFRIFSQGIDRWWPREHHIGSSPIREVVLEPRLGGRWYSLCEDGSEVHVGKVLTWDPPTRLVLSWQITAAWQFDPDFSTEVEVSFQAEGPKATRVTLEHRQLERYAEAGADIRAQLDDADGWQSSFEQFARVARMKAILLYESAPDVLTKAPLHFMAHKARLEAFEAAGELLAVGTYADPREGSLAVFRSREAAAEFIKEDPFVLHGVVSKSTIKDWDEMLLG